MYITYVLISILFESAYKTSSNNTFYPCNKDLQLCDLLSVCLSVLTDTFRLLTSVRSMCRLKSRQSSVYLETLNRKQSLSLRTGDWWLHHQLDTVTATLVTSLITFIFGTSPVFINFAPLTTAGQLIFLQVKPNLLLLRFEMLYSNFIA